MSADSVRVAAPPHPTLSRLRVLRGPNVFRAAPAITCEVLPSAPGVHGPADPALHRRVEAALAELEPDARAGAVADDASWAQLIAQLALALQRRAGSPVHWSATRFVPEDDGWTLAVEFEEEDVGLDAVEDALEIVRDCIDDERPRIERLVDRLRRRWEREHLGPTATVLVEAARQRGIPVRRTPGEYVVQLGYGKHLHRLDATMTDRTNVIATDITSDKDRTKRVLGRLGLPVPRGGVAETVEDAQRIVRDIGFPVLLKPLDANNGRGTSPRIDDADEVPVAFARAKAEHPVVVIERYVTGNDHRVLVVDGRVIAVTERVPAHVVGDGVRTIRALAESINEDPRRSKADPTAPLAPLPLDELTQEFIARGGRTLDSVPAAGEVVHLRSTANISTGGTPIDRTDRIHPENATLCGFAADAVGLDVAGIDVLTSDIGVPFRESGATIIEVNASPGIRMHTDPTDGTPRDVPGAILDMLYPPGAPTTIPIVAVTGTNGKTTTTRLVAHLFRTAGNRVGFTTTDGVYWQEQLIFEGDMTGPMAADMVLSNPRVDVAVLETARGGILRAGLGFDACDVGVVLNVTADHLGLAGIHTVEQLAEVKGVIASAVKPGGHAVLNADDARVLAMRARTRGEIALFSLRARTESPDFAAHVAAGGLGVNVEEGAIVLHRARAATPVIAVDDVPLTLRGAATFQLQNAIAACLAGAALGLTLDQLRAGLATFRASAETTPGRMNIVEVAGGTLILDYAHNEAAIGALLDFAARVPAGKRIGVLGMPGDRRDEDLATVARLARGLDHVLLKEHPHYRRGRAPGETARVMKDALVAAGFPADRVEYLEGERAAIRRALDLMSAGDLIVFLADDAPEVFAEVRARQP